MLSVAGELTPRSLSQKGQYPWFLSHMEAQCFVLNFHSWRQCFSWNKFLILIIRDFTRGGLFMFLHVNKLGWEVESVSMFHNDFSFTN